MTDEELKAMKKDVAKKKRIASEFASQLHDLVEDRLPAAFEELPELSQSTYDACLAWAEANKAYQAAQQ
jgi:hypothetical protein